MPYDLIAICGMPRSGTTYLHRIFAGCVVPRKYMGDQFIASSTVQLKQKKFKPHVPFEWTLEEPQSIANLLAAGKAPWSKISDYIKFWRRWCNGDKTIVYKHPQLIFAGIPTRRFKYKVLYVLCTRKNFNHWKASAKEHVGTDLHNPNMHWLVSNWPQHFDTPEEPDERYRIFYQMCIDRMNWLRDQQIDYVDFVYEQPEEGIRLLAGKIGSSVDVKSMLNESWRPRRK